MNRFRIILMAVACLGACASFDDVEDHGARACRGRIGRRLEIEFDSGRTTFSHDVPSGVLTADVRRVANDYRHRRVDVLVEFHNRSDDPLHVAVADVQLVVHDQRFAAKLSKDLEMPPLRPRTRQQVEFTFELDAPPRGEVFPLVIGKVYPFAREFALRVAVPGARTPAAAPAPTTTR